MKMGKYLGIFTLSTLTLKIIKGYLIKLRNIYVVERGNLGKMKINNKNIVRGTTVHTVQDIGSILRVHGIPQNRQHNG